MIDASPAILEGDKIFLKLDLFIYIYQSDVLT